MRQKKEKDNERSNNRSQIGSEQIRKNRTYNFIKLDNRP